MSRKKVSFRRIGFDGGRDYPLFLAVLNDAPNPRRTVCFSAGIHGDEISGPLAAVEFINKFDFDGFRDIKVIILPFINIYGFLRQTRRNSLNKDLNRHFCDARLTGTNKLLYDAVKRENIFFFHALHEDSGEKRFYLYNFENKKEKVYRDVIELAGKTVPINNSSVIHKNRAIKGMVTNRLDGSFEDRLFRNGVPFSMCTEAPGRQPLEKRVGLNLKIMESVMEFSKIHG